MAAFDEAAIAIVRRAYAAQMLAVAGVDDDPALFDAFAAVPRELFLGPPPWSLALPGGYVALPKADPVLAYQDVLFALAPERGVNNGSPSLHARWLHRARIRPGECVVQAGAGTGYYTAPAWLDGLNPGGRLILPLGVPWPGRGRPAMRGAGLRIERRGALSFAAESLGPAAFVCAEGEAGGLRGGERERDALRAAFEGGGVDFVRSLVWRRPPSATRSWYAGPDWSLSYDEPI